MQEYNEYFEGQERINRYALPYDAWLARQCKQYPTAPYTRAMRTGFSDALFQRPYNPPFASGHKLVEYDIGWKAGIESGITAPTEESCCKRF